MGDFRAYENKVARFVVYQRSRILDKKTLDSNDQNQVTDQRFSLKRWFAGGAQYCGFRKPAGCGHCYLRFFLRTGRIYVGNYFCEISRSCR